MIKVKDILRYVEPGLVCRANCERMPQWVRLQVESRGNWCRCVNKQCSAEVKEELSNGR